MRQEKQFLLDEIKHKIQSSQAFIVAGYKQLPAKTMTDFRRKVGGNFAVVRKRVFLKAIESEGISLDKDLLAGHIGIVFAPQDPIEITKKVFEFSKETNDSFQVLGGHFDGKIYTAADVERLSKLPSLPEMRAQFLGLLEAPMAQTLAVMDALLTSVIHCIENKRQKEEEQKS